MTWNQPQCERCWVDQHTDDDGSLRVPVRVVADREQPERCAWCGYPTWVGIYVRANPSSLPPADAGDVP